MYDHGEDICDWWFKFSRFTLFIWKPEMLADPWWKAILHPASKQFGIGKKYGDGCMAIAMPWFLLYLD